MSAERPDGSTAPTPTSSRTGEHADGRDLTQATPGPDSTDFEQAALQHLDALYRTALRMTHNAQDAEDLVQDALVRAYRFYDRFQQGTNFRAWLFKILTNTYINTYRRKHARPQESSLEDADDHFLYHQLTGPLAGAIDDVEGTVLDRLGADAIQRAVDQLPPQFRTTVQLADVEGLSYADIAEATGVAKGTVMSRLFRGRRQLQRALWEQARAAGYAEGSKTRSDSVDGQGQTGEAEPASTRKRARGERHADTGNVRGGRGMKAQQRAAAERSAGAAGQRGKAQ